jgi:hypothetical protein
LFHALLGVRQQLLVSLLAWVEQRLTESGNLLQQPVFLQDRKVARVGQLDSLNRVNSHNAVIPLVRCKHGEPDTFVQYQRCLLLMKAIGIGSRFRVGVGARRPTVGLPDRVTDI